MFDSMRNNKSAGSVCRALIAGALIAVGVLAAGCSSGGKGISAASVAAEAQAAKADPAAQAADKAAYAKELADFRSHSPKQQAIYLEWIASGLTNGLFRAETMNIGAPPPSIGEILKAGNLLDSNGKLKVGGYSHIITDILHLGIESTSVATRSLDVCKIIAQQQELLPDLGDPTKYACAPNPDPHAEPQDRYVVTYSNAP